MDRSQADGANLDGLTDAERAWALHSEELWARAHRIAQAHPGMDAGDVYHALHCLELEPSARLRRARARGRLRTHAAERALFAALQRHGVLFLMVGMGAAVLEGAPVATQDIALWFERGDEDALRRAARDAGGFWISGFGMQPPSFVGEGLDRLVVLTAHGLDSFAVEYARSLERVVDGIPLRVLPLERVIASKRAARRAEDLTQLPALEATLAARREK